MTTEITEAQSIARLAAKPFIEFVNGMPVLMTPGRDGAWDSHEMTHLLDKPMRLKGSSKATDAQSFIDLCKRHGTPENSLIYLNVDYINNKVSATVVYNDHTTDQTPGWRDHTTVFTPQLSEEWKKWNDNSGSKMSQESFAKFLQENIADIQAPEDSSLPSGTRVLEFVTQLEETRTVKFKSGTNLQNGMVQIQYIEDGDDGTRGNLDVFKEFGIGVSPFFNGDAYSVKAYLRYSINRNTAELTFTYELQRPYKILEDACKVMIDRIKAETGLPVVFGLPA